MDKQIVVRPYAAIKMEQTIDIYIYCWVKGASLQMEI